MLTRQCNGNVHDKGLVVISASSNEDNAKNLVDYGSDSGYESAVRPSSWLCFDFKDMNVKMSSDSIQSPEDGASGLKNWVIEGSTNGQDWGTLDRRSNCSELDGPKIVGTFWVFRGAEVRLIQTEENHAGKMSFGLGVFEFYEGKSLVSGLTRMGSGNIHDRGLVTCSASSGSDDWPAKNAADPADGFDLFSENRSDQWICYDMGKMKMTPTGNLLKTAEGGNPREWVIEDSIDGTTWTELCEGRSAKNVGVNERFTMPECLVRMVRLRQTRKNYLSGHQLGVSFFDVFGAVVWEVAAAVSPKRDR
jgi:hypothetical protein